MLSPEILAELPCQLPKLQYLGWETHDEKALYRLEHKDGKVVAVKIDPIIPPDVRKDLWFSDAILDHFGAAARNW